MVAAVRCGARIHGTIPLNPTLFASETRIMNRPSFAVLVSLLMVATTLVADEKRRNEPLKLPPNESVKWMPNRDVKDAILKEIDKFGTEMKTKLGPKTLAFKPYIAVNDSPEAAALEATTVEHMLDHMQKQLRKLADHDNEKFLPMFQAYRRAPIASGSDILTEPLFSKYPRVNQLSGNWTFKLDWELVDGRFKNNWENNDVDEVYEVELNATLTLGIAMSTTNDEKLMVIDHSVTKPIVTGWRISLVASEGKVQKILPAKRSNEKDGR